jgi:hypothetical protein
VIWFQRRAQDVDEFQLVDNLVGTMMEASSIVACAALLTFGRVASSPGVGPDAPLIWFNAAAQLATSVVFNFVDVVATGKFHCLEWRRIFPRSTLRFLAYMLVVLTIGGCRQATCKLLLCGGRGRQRGSSPLPPPAASLSSCPPVDGSAHHLCAAPGHLHAAAALCHAHRRRRARAGRSSALRVPPCPRRLCLELLLLFCPKVYDGQGLLLEQCDRPSIFQAISFSFANRARGTLVGTWLEVGDVNGTSGVNA